MGVNSQLQFQELWMTGIFGSLPYELTEGDILIIFSQYGIPVHLKLVRDKGTGKSKGFGYLKYEDQRSTILAVDNLNGTKVLGRIIRVDHAYYEERDRDEDYEKMLNEELKNDFADGEDNEESEGPTQTQDDEFQDPLLLMQKKDENEKSRNHSRSHQHHHHRSHKREGDNKDREHREREKGSEHRHKGHDGSKHNETSNERDHRSERKHRSDHESSERREKRHRREDDKSRDSKGSRAQSPRKEDKDYKPQEEKV
ncbi:unnamed protein product [Wickerhamomyces anomalus]